MIGGRVIKLVRRDEIGGRWSDFLIMDGRKRAEGSRVYYDLNEAWDSYGDLCHSYVVYMTEGGKL